MDQSGQHPVDRQVSDRIKICRVLGIFFVVLVHLQPHARPIEGAPLIVEAARYFFINILGHAAVPLLSVISGYLLINACSSKSWTAYVWHRFQVLYVPMVVWNILFAAALVLLYRAGFETTSMQRMIETGPVNSILSLSAPPINGPLYFLRDMFVISIFSPLIIRAMRAAPWTVLLACAVLVALRIGPPVIFRPITLLCFCAGLFLWLKQADLKRLDSKFPHILTFSALFWIAGGFLAFSSNLSGNVFRSIGWFDYANRFVVIIVFWTLSARIARSAALPGFLFLERFIYLVFLSHTVTLLFVGGAFKVVFAGYDTLFYLLLMATAPFLCVLAAWAMLPLVRHLPAAFRQAVTGRAGVARTGAARTARQV